MRKLIVPIIILCLYMPTAEASIQDVQMRLDTAIQYPNDRQVNIVVEAMAFENDKPSLSSIDVNAEIRWPNGTIMYDSKATLNPGIRSSIIFPSIDDVGKYYVFVYGEAGGVRSNTESQTMRITFAPQLYTAGFLSEGKFIVTPTEKYVNLTIQEYLDTGISILPGKSYKTNGSYLKVDVPDGYLAVRYNIIDENGWMNYERAETTGLTVHGSPYVWIYGDLERVEPISSLVGVTSILIGILGAGMILVGCFLFFNRFREQTLKRRKEDGTDNLPGWSQRRREQRYREQQERDYWQRQQRYRGRF
jgi:hypothetical protein